MSKIINKLPPHIVELSEATKNLAKKSGFVQAQKVINAVVKLLGIETENSWKAFTDSQNKIRSNAGWFMEADGFADRRATYKISDSDTENIDLKAFWVKKTNKSVISWLVALTPNFEDEPFYGNRNLGIDFVIPEKADRVIVILSKNYVIRTLELSGELSVTQQEIFDKWLVDFDFTNKSQVHEILWQSFDIEPLNKRFYKEISSFFIELKGYLTKAKVFDDRHAAYFVNRLIGRIVFCWFLEKKNIINPDIKYFETEGKNATKYYHDKLETLFFKVFNTPVEDREKGVERKTPFLNGGLFEAKPGDKFGSSELTFPADYFDRLLGFLRHYNFTTDESTSTFQQVAIDPEMLGRIFENLLAEQVEETGEQARKAKGAFYTPREIVDYMCRESLREYLKSQFSENEDATPHIDQLIDTKEHDWRDQQKNYRDKLKNYKYDLLKALDNLKIIDPACGSGAFPMGMLALLVEIYERLDTTFDPYKKKLAIIKNSIYGVDIEPMAVEISRLRAWLSIIVDEEKIEPLPNLDFKFVCANSLIPLKSKSGQQNMFDTENLAEKMQEIRDKYYNARTKKSKQNLQKKYERLLEGGQQKMFSSRRESQLRSYHPFDEENVTEFFDPEFTFGVRNGFDVVIGNPPYGVKFSKSEKDFFRKLYPESEFKIDSFSLFILRTCLLLVENGICSYIIPNTLLDNYFETKVREKLLKENRINFIIDLSDKVFESAVVHSMIFSFSRCKKEEYSINTGISGGLEENLIQIPKSYFLDEPNYVFSIRNYEYKNILEKTKLNSLNFNKIISLRQTIKTGNDKKYISDIREKENYRKILRGKDVGRYLYLDPNLFVNYGKHLACSRNCEIFEQPKILIRETGNKVIATYDENRYYIMSSLYNGILINSDFSLKYILALLSSRLFQFILNLKVFKKTEGAFTKAKIYHYGELPIKNIKLKDQQTFISVVNQILTAKKDNPKADTSELEDEIDEMVFDLYGLSEDERKVVLGS